MKTLTQISTLTLLLTSLFFFAPQIVSAQDDGDDEYVWIGYDPDSGIGEELTTTFVAAPNPVSGEYIKLLYQQLDRTTSVTVLDAQGKQYHASRIENPERSNGEYRISTSGLASGVYFIRLRNEIIDVTKKIFVR